QSHNQSPLFCSGLLLFLSPLPYSFTSTKFKRAAIAAPLFFLFACRAFALSDAFIELFLFVFRFACRTARLIAWFSAASWLFVAVFFRRTDHFRCIFACTADVLRHADNFKIDG